jgi:protein phosphatase
VLELDQVRDGAGPRTNAVVVGSAAISRNRPTSAQDGPAARAAELSRQAAASTPGAGVPEVEADDEVEDADERRARRRRRTRGVLLTLLAVLVLAAGAFGFYRWTQTQYFVGVDGEVVAIYRGIPQSVGPIALSEVVETTDVAVDDLPEFVRNRVEQTIHTASLADARDRVDALVEDAAEAGATPTPRPTPTPSTTTAAP